jgi:hemerythrin
MPSNESGHRVPALVWDNSLEVGDAILDAQHRHLVDLINALYRATQGDGLATADIVVNYIGRFLEQHFETEESLLRRAAYIGLEQHAAEHRKLLAQVREAAHSIRSGDKMDAERFATVTWTCLHEHTTSWDQEYAKVLRRRRER